MKKILSETFFGKPFWVPSNLNVWYVFGALLLCALVLQFISGLWLTMFYQPSSSLAFASVQHIIRDVPYGWLIRQMHVVGASALFILLYLHMLRGLLYRSYRSPREYVWFFGVLLFWLMLAEGFLGYLLPWGQMSYWGAAVVTNLVTALPHGETLALYLRGDYQVSGVTLTRFYALHVVALPVALIFVIQWHIRMLHLVGSGNPSLSPLDTRVGKDPLRCQPFFPYQAMKDVIAIIIFLMLFAACVFFIPTFFIEKLNLIPANPLQTPNEIRPLWYLASFYSLLRAVPSKLGGVLVLALSMLMWFFVPWLDRIFSKGIGRWHKCLVMLWMLSWMLLTLLGLYPVAPTLTGCLLGLSVLYFILFFLAIFV